MPPKDTGPIVNQNDLCGVNVLSEINYLQTIISSAFEDPAECDVP
jgi:hypothetical protein